MEMENFLKLIKEFKSTKNKKAYLFVLIEKSRKIEFPTYSLIQLLNSINLKPHKVISSEGWIEKDYDLEQQRKSIEKEKAKLQRERKEFEENKKGNSYLKGSIIGISIILFIVLFLFYMGFIPNFKTTNEEELWNKTLIENTIASYNYFMNQYPKSKYCVIAKQKNKTLKEKLKNNISLIDSTNSLVSGEKIRKKLRVSSIKKQNNNISNNDVVNEEPEADYQEALNYYYKAKEKYSLKDLKSAHSFIQTALLYDPDNNKYNNFKTTIENSLASQEDEDPIKKKVKSTNVRENKKSLVKESIPESNLKSKENKTIVKNEIHENSLPYTVVEQVPVYPGCKGSNIERKKCTSNKIAKFFKKKYRTVFANKLGLKSGKKRVFVQFTINKNGRVMNIKAKGPNKRMEEEAVRVAKLLPQMIPGKHEGILINVKYTLPINLIIE